MIWQFKTYIKLIRAAETINVNAHRHLTEDNLTQSQFAVLELLHHKGPQHQSDIAKVFPRHARIVADQFALLNVTELEDLGLLCRRLGQFKIRKDETS